MIEADNLGKGNAKFFVGDGLMTLEGVEPREDPLPLNESDKLGWVMENGTDSFEMGDSGLNRGYFSINMRRALASSEPFDINIPADASQCNYFYGGAYRGVNEKLVLTANLPGFIPNAACKDSYTAEGSMTLTAALGATTAVLALLAF